MNVDDIAREYPRAAMLEVLRACNDRRELADLLEIPVQKLTHLIYKSNPSERYHDFCISKKNGASRQISAPNPALKSLQDRLARILNSCDVELDQKYGVSCRANVGFTPGVGILENSYRHRQKRYVFNIDIENFFGSINFGRIRGYYLKDRNFLLSPDVATTIAQICCHNGHLPQGSPCSPVITNLLCRFFDIRMVKLARKSKCRYTRYADDLTFTTNTVEFPKAIAVRSDSPQGWSVGAVLRKEVLDSGFQINQSKTRMSLRHSRQMATGLICNDKPNVTREYYLAARAAAHNLMKNGSCYVGRSIQVTPTTV